MQKTGEKVVMVIEREDLCYLTNREVIKKTIRKKRHTMSLKILMILNRRFFSFWFSSLKKPEDIYKMLNIFQRTIWIMSIILILH